MFDRLKGLALAILVVVLLGGAGYVGGEALAPEAAVAHDIAGCTNTACVDGACESLHDCGCVDTDGDGVCDRTEPCAADADCSTDGGGGGSGDQPGDGCFSDYDDCFCDNRSIQCSGGCCD